MPSKSFHIQEVGDVNFVKNKRAKFLRIAVKPGGKIRVTLPSRCSYSEAMDFVLQKSQQIQACLEKINAKKRIFDENRGFKCKSFSLKILKHAKNKCEYDLTGGHLHFYYPKNTDVSDLKVQDEIKTAIIKALRVRAKQYLPARVEQIAKKYNFNYKKVFIKNLKSRWGSCSSVNNINLNLHLMRLPDYLADYVILHELAHTKEKNHGKGFRELLDSIVINSKQLDKELRGYSIEEL